jgi:hypothetical protein
VLPASQAQGQRCYLHACASPVGPLLCACAPPSRPQVHVLLLNTSVPRRPWMPYVPQVTVLYNLCNEPWSKYSLGAVADRGLRPRQWTSVRLRAEVLLLETDT